MKTKLSLTDQLTAAKLEIGNTLEHYRHTYTNGQTLKAIHAESCRVSIMRLGMNSTGSPMIIKNAASFVMDEIRGSICADLGRTAALVAALEASETYQEACAIIDPLIAEVRRIEAAIAAEAHAELTARNEREQAKAAALEKAAAEVEAAFA